jgi:N6-L-threonylcarbamoyladenine synthase
MLVGGGVSANTRLRHELAALATDAHLPLYLPPMDLCVDNAAMIAALGAQIFRDRGPDDLTLTAMPSSAADASE